MKVVAIIQARMGSTRLPGKVLMDLAGEPMLARVVNRTRRAAMLDEVVVATTTQPADEAIVRLCVERRWSCFRGSEDDVRDRYYQAAVAHQADVIVRITSDCPLIEPVLVDRVVQEYLAKQPSVDYVSNDIPRPTFPRGLDVEVFSTTVLKRACREDHNPAGREHVTHYIRRNPALFRLAGVTNDLDLSHLRWTVDTEEDLAFARLIFDSFSHNLFSWKDVLSLLVDHPEWVELNRHVRQKTVPGLE